MSRKKRTRKIANWDLRITIFACPCETFPEVWDRDLRMERQKVEFLFVKNPPAEQVALEPTPIRGLTFVHSKKIVLSYLQSALIAIQEETPISICTV